MSDSKTKEEYIVDFIKTFAQYEYQMEPYKDGKRDLRKSYKENGYLTTEEMRQAVKAYRAVQKDQDLEETQRFKELLEKELGIDNV